MTEKYILKPLDWDTAFFGVSCARVMLNEALSEQETENMLELCKDFDFVTIENTCGDPVNDFYLGTKSNAYITDCAVTLKKKSEPHSLEELEGNSIRLAVEEDLAWIEKIAGNAFSTSRFYNDPCISKEKASDLYKSWARNAFKDENKKIFVTDEQSGFLIYYQNGKDAHLNLIAAGGENRKKGVGTALTKYADNYAFENGCEDFYVGTQSVNLPAINLYVKCGFRFSKATKIFHLRKD